MARGLEGPLIGFLFLFFHGLFFFGGSAVVLEHVVLTVEGLGEATGRNVPAGTCGATDSECLADEGAVATTEVTDVVKGLAMNVLKDSVVGAEAVDGDEQVLNEVRKIGGLFLGTFLGSVCGTEITKEVGVDGTMLKLRVSFMGGSDTVVDTGSDDAVGSGGRDHGKLGSELMVCGECGGYIVWKVYLWKVSVEGLFMEG